MQSIEHKIEVADIHYESRLRLLSFQALIENIFDTQNYIRQIQEVINRKKAKRMIMKCYTRWSLIIMKIKKQNAKNRSFENHYNHKVCKLFLDTLREQNKKKNGGFNLFRKKLEWKLKQKVFGELVVRLLDSKYENQEKHQTFYEDALKRKGLKHLRSMRQVNCRDVIQVLKAFRQRRILAEWARITLSNTETRQKILSI